MYKGVGGFALVILQFFLRRFYSPFGLFETRLFHFHRKHKNGGREGCSSEPPLDLPLDSDETVCKSNNLQGQNSRKILKFLRSHFS